MERPQGEQIEPTVGARLARWQAHLDLERKIYSYPEAIDSGDLDAVGRFFEHAELLLQQSAGQSPFRVASGREAAIHAFGSSNVRYRNGTFNTKHVLTNVIIDMTDDMAFAKVRAYVTVFQAAPGFPLQPIYAGRIHDEYRSAARGWELVRRLMFPDLLGDTSHHLASPLRESRDRQ